MKHLSILLPILLLTVLRVTAQEAANHTLEVTGTSSASISPDLTTVRLHVSAIHMQYARALESLDKKMKALAGRLEQVGFEKTDIKTQDFSIRKNTLYKDRTRVDSGYVASQYAMVEFPLDKKKLGNVIKAIGASETETNMQIAFALSDAKRKEAREQLIRTAIVNAREQAHIIVDEANLHLVNISRIRYDPEDQQYPGPMYKTAARAEDSAGFDLEARDIDLREKIVIQWKIE